jgi:hypothetical protein
MTFLDSIAQQLNLLGGQLAFLLFLIASIRLFFTQKSGATTLFLIGMLITWGGLLGQLLVPLPEPTYIMDGEEIIGATGAFPESWVVSSIAFYIGLMVASVGLVWHAFAKVSKGDGAKVAP